jgi:hypothetical protein
MARQIEKGKTAKKSQKIDQHLPEKAYHISGKVKKARHTTHSPLLLEVCKIFLRQTAVMYVPTESGELETINFHVELFESTKVSPS